MTGAASGMGLATAKAFAEAGAAVTLADVSEGGAQSAAEDLVAAGHKAIAVRCDVANVDEVAAMVDFYFIATAADGNKGALERTIEGLRGFTSCVRGAREKGIVYGTGAMERRRHPFTPGFQRGLRHGEVGVTNAACASRHVEGWFRGT